MSSINRPKRALLAYCALAERINGANAGMFGALAPFFAPVCREFAGQMFDAQAFSNEVAKLYGLRIPRLAVLGLAEQLEAQGLLVSVATRPVAREGRYYGLLRDRGDRRSSAAAVPKQSPVTWLALQTGTGRI